MRQICAVSPSVMLIKAVCLLAVYLVPSVIGTNELRNHQQADIRTASLATDQRAHHRHRYLRLPASGVEDINVSSPSIQRERRESSTVCAECNQAGTTRAAGPPQGNDHAATNNYERSDEKQETTASGAEPEQKDMEQDEGENADGSPTWSYFEPTLQPTVEADNPGASAYWTQTKEDEHKAAESLEEDIDCPWCHDDELDRGPDRPSSGDGGFPDKSFPDDPYDYPKASPDSYRDNNEGYGSAADHRLIDDMVAPFFLLAAVLLILALVYTLLFLCVVRLGTIRIDEDRYPRGRVYFCGSFCFVPLCWFYRLYAADPSGSVGIASTSDARVMGLRREERKEAVTELLIQYSATVGEEGDDGQMDNAGATSHSDDNIASNISSTENPASPTETETAVTTMTPSSGEDAANINLTDADENQCSICLDGYGKWPVNNDFALEGVRSFHPASFYSYQFNSFSIQHSLCTCAEPGDIYVTSPTTCPHRFHHDCLLDWLTRRCNTACPCCRRDLISNDDVWDIHQEKGRERRRKRRKEQGGIRNRFGGFRRGGRRQDVVSAEGGAEAAGTTSNSVDRPAAQAQEEIPSSPTLTSPTSNAGASGVESGHLDASETFESEERV